MCPGLNRLSASGGNEVSVGALVNPSVVYFELNELRLHLAPTTTFKNSTLDKIYAFNALV